MAKPELPDEDGTGVPSFREELGTRLRELESGFVNREEAAKAAGVAKSTLQRWIEGKSDPSFEGLVRLASAAGVSIEWLATGGGRKKLTVDELRQQVDRIGKSFVMIPRYNVEASAGPGALSSDENIIDHMAFQEGWVRRVLRADPRKLALISAVGDSMEPTIRAGDLLLVDTGVNEVIDDAIYVIAMDGHLMVKRLQRFFSGAVSVKSDNAAYVEQTLSAEEAGYARIAGRVRWIGRLI
jgi:phage repressor protein C with HTH and peptisase S24 domain